mmetsp:Transcript_31506/g.46137  ORF Transcript_31506/g.46137 Transcript_31506/m.46137 type:complete len:120 (-) Transcript_31506:369-728(-)
MRTIITYKDMMYNIIILLIVIKVKHEIIIIISLFLFTRRKKELITFCLQGSLSVFAESQLSPGLQQYRAQLIVQVLHKSYHTVQLKIPHSQHLHLVGSKQKMKEKGGLNYYSSELQKAF